MKKIIFILLIAFASNSFAQQLEAGGKYRISYFLGLDSTRTEFEIEPLEQFGRAGYLLDLREDNTFTIYGYAFCGVGEKAYVEGTYQLLEKHRIVLNFTEIIYRDMGTETRRVGNKKSETYVYDLEKHTLNRMQKKETSKYRKLI